MGWHKKIRRSAKAILKTKLELKLWQWQLRRNEDRFCSKRSTCSSASLMIFWFVNILIIFISKENYLLLYFDSLIVIKMREYIIKPFVCNLWAFWAVSFLWPTNTRFSFHFIHFDIDCIPAWVSTAYQLALKSLGSSLRIYKISDKVLWTVETE